LQTNLDASCNEIKLGHRGHAAKPITTRFGMEKVERMSRAQRCDQFREAQEKGCASRCKFSYGE
jgi:hypothetical protein